LFGDGNKKAGQARDNSSTKFLRNVVVLIAGISLAFGLTTLAIFEDKVALLYFADLSINVVAGTALFLAFLIVWRQKLGGLHGKTYAAFAIGLVLWFAAELVQTYYEIGVDDEVPFPSIADALWLAGYGPFGYHLFVTYRFFNKSARPHNLTIVVAATAGIFGSLVPIIVLNSSLLTDNLLELVVNVLYPSLDAALIVPAIMTFSILRKGRLTAVPWVLLSASILIIAAADSIFGYIAATNPDSEIWGFGVFYLSGYLCMGGALYCHNRFFIFSKARAVKIWQEENR
jgi:hypothetical protein